MDRRRIECVDDDLRIQTDDITVLTYDFFLLPVGDFHELDFSDPQQLDYLTFMQEENSW